MQADEYKFALDKNLNVSADEFCTLWNSTDYVDLVKADTERTRGGILGVETVNEVLVVLGNIATGVASSAVYDLIVRFFASRGQHVKLQQRQSTAGDPIVVIAPDEAFST